VNWHAAGVERGDLVLRAGQLGTALSYDLTTGKLKHQITAGEGNVTQLPASMRKLERLFQAVGKEKGRVRTSAIFTRLHGRKRARPAHARRRRSRHWPVAVGTILRRQLFATGSADDVSVRNANGQGFSFSRKSMCRRRHGMETADADHVKARDGKTDLRPPVRPTNLDSTKKYPIINHIYPGPQTGSVGGRSFNATRGDAQSSPSWGRRHGARRQGTPWRSKAFHDAYYANMGAIPFPIRSPG
jgi:hypothetical protein